MKNEYFILLPILCYITQDLSINVDFYLTSFETNFSNLESVDAENEGQDFREDIDVRIQASTETLDHQHAENHAAEGSVLLDSMTDHRGE